MVLFCGPREAMLSVSRPGAPLKYCRCTRATSLSGSVSSALVLRAACGASLDVPLSHKDDSWSFDHFDTITVSMPDAPRPDEIVVVLVVADGGRPHPRCGTAPR
jgi:hypothetical protein